MPLHAQNQVLPRNKDSIKTGCLEGILEEFRLMIERANSNADGNNNNDSTTKVQLPHFVYASSHEVYDRISTAHQKKEQTQLQPQAGQGQGQEVRTQPNPPPFQEDKPITTPSSLHGTAKLIDEILASAYHTTHGIYSVGMRFFKVYGPWDTPGTEVFELAEQFWAMNDGIGEKGGDKSVLDDPVFDDDINDYIYIDDAIDAILGAMQYRPYTIDDNPPPVVFNVGTGKGFSRKQVKEEMGKHFPKFLTSKLTSSSSPQTKVDPAKVQRLPTKSIASTERTEALLGFKARVSLEEGLAHTLAWHRDRTFPYGRDPNFEESFEVRSIESKIGKSLAMSRRRASTSSDKEESEKIAQKDGDEYDDEECSPLDRECLRGELVFPCASECRRVEWCTPSAWDDIATLSTMVTTGCDAVLYTVLLDETTEQIPNAATASLPPDSLPFIGAGLPEDIGERTQARCNIAFVSDKSPLVEMLKSEGEEYLDEGGDANGSGSGGSLPPLLRHGFWTVLPVSTSSSSSWLHAFGGTFSLEYLPKISPGRFFGSSVRYAVYAAPTVLVNNLPYLLKRMEDGLQQPQLLKNGSPSSTSSNTALLISSKRNTCDPAQRGSSCSTTYTRPPTNDGIQSNAYNMIRMALHGEMLGGGLESLLDSSVLVHSLREEESRLFRCDVYGEVAQWGASSDERAFEFVISVHDLWSRAVTHWSTGLRPWWIDLGGEDGTEGAAVEGGKKLGNNNNAKSSQKKQRRRLLPSDGSTSMGELWMSILSSADYQIFTLILPPDSMGIVHFE